MLLDCDRIGSGTMQVVNGVSEKCVAVMKNSPHFHHRGKLRFKVVVIFSSILNQIFHLGFLTLVRSVICFFSKMIVKVIRSYVPAEESLEFKLIIIHTSTSLFATWCLVLCTKVICLCKLGGKGTAAWLSLHYDFRICSWRGCNGIRNQFYIFHITTVIRLL